MPFIRLLSTSVAFAGLLSFSATAQTTEPTAAAPANPPVVISSPPAAAPTPVAATTAPATVATAAPAASGPVTREELPALVREILMNDPSIIIKAVDKMRAQKMEEAKKKAQDALTKNKADLLNDTGVPSTGDVKTADVTIVEFFDYHCGYCKHLVPELNKVLAEDKKIRVLFREFPILSEESVLASRAALAVNRIAKDKYFAYHQTLMKHDGKFDEKMLLDAATKIGVSAEKVKAEMANPEITAQLDKNRDLAQALDIRGTPALIIGENLVPGAVSYDELKQSIADVRAGKTPSILTQPPAGEMPAEGLEPATN